MSASRLSFGRTVYALALGIAVMSAQSAFGGEPTIPVPTPIVSNARAGQHGFPFISSSLNLASRKYVEKEFLFAGTARAFVNAGEWANDGRWPVTLNPGVTAPYKVRMLVRRPVDPSRFNGTVIVEWLNVSAGFDLAFDWAFAKEEMIDEGYAYVGVTVQHLGATGLQDWEEGPGDRYAAISHPGDSFAFDIYSQAGRAIRRPRSGDPKPLGELTDRIKAVIADGESQSAYYLFTYYNAIHPSARVYDGFLLHGTGFGAPLSMDIADFWGSPIPDGVPATTWIDAPYPSKLRTDSATPLLVVQAETDLSDFLGGAARSIHGQADAKYLRIWEIAGTAHFDGWVISRTQPDLDKTLPGIPPLACNAPPVNPGNSHAYAMNAAIHALNLWVRHGYAPASAPRLSFNVPEDDLATINTDPSTGLAIGGLRLPDVAVPIATLSGFRQDAAVDPPDSCAFQFGTYDRWNRDSDTWDGQVGLDVSPTPEPDLQLLYPTRSDYLRKVAEATLRSTLAGFLRPRDAVTVLRDAARADVP